MSKLLNLDACVKLSSHPEEINVNHLKYHFLNHALKMGSQDTTAKSELAAIYKYHFSQAMPEYHLLRYKLKEICSIISNF